MENSPSQNQSVRPFAVELIRFILIAVLIVVPIRFFIAKPFIVSGESMHPSFENANYLIVDQLSYRLHSPAREDVVIFRYPRDPSKFFIKRIIGLPGETVRMEDGEVTVFNEKHPQGLKLAQPYINTKTFESLTISLRSDEYFVLGDNRAESSDSRVWGPLESTYIVGTPFARLFPPSKIGLHPGSVKSSE